MTNNNHILKKIIKHNNELNSLKQKIAYKEFIEHNDNLSKKNKALKLLTKNNPSQKSKDCVLNLKSIKKDKFIFYIYLYQRWQKRVTINFNASVNTSYVKYEVYVIIAHNDIKTNELFYQTFLEEEISIKHFNNLINYITNYSEEYIFQSIDALYQKEKQTLQNKLKNN